MSNRGQTLVKGHSLIGEGAPHDANGDLTRFDGWRIIATGPGRAKCRCGWLSGELPSRNARRRAHAAHKIDVLNAS